MAPARRYRLLRDPDLPYLRTTAGLPGSAVAVYFKTPQARNRAAHGYAKTDGRTVLLEDWSEMNQEWVCIDAIQPPTG
jgi:hypothetical protein